jgi:L-seryl-tRNA(Ser) seleniumtransferase
MTGDRPPSVDRLARSVVEATQLPHAVAVHIARTAIAQGPPAWRADEVIAAAERFRADLLGPVVNATGVLLHTNLGRAPLGIHHPPAAMNLEFDMQTGERGSRQRSVGGLLAQLCGAEAALVVNNNAAAVLLVVAALAAGRDVAVSRGESVEIGGSFRVPEVMEQSGARLIDVGTTNRTRLADYAAAVNRPGSDVALTLKIHPSNYRVEGFVEDTSVAQLASLPVPVVADIGSGLIDSTCPWLPGAPPAWLSGEPAARQAIADGAALVTFSGDKLLGGPQAGIIAGRADLVRVCAQHPLMRALRPGGHVLAALQQVALSYLAKTVVADVPFWRMVATPVVELRGRAEAVVAAAGQGQAVASDALPGAGSAPGVTMPSCAVQIDGDRVAALRTATPPVIARTRDGVTLLDLRSVDPADDGHLVVALRAVGTVTAATSK